MKKSEIYDVSELPVVMNCDDVALTLGISRSAAYELAKSEGFPSVIVGIRRTIIPRDRFIEWLELRSR